MAIQTHSLAQLLSQMKDKPVTLGWGAILAVGRAQMNQFLKQQYFQAFGELKFFPPFNAEVDLDNSGYLIARLSDVVLGPPELFFDVDPESGLIAKMRMSLVGGTYSKFQYETGIEEPVFQQSQRIAESMGFTIETTLSLAEVLGVIDQSGQARLEFSSEELTYSCNLEIDGPALELGAAFKSFISAQESFRLDYNLGHISLKDYNFLSPAEFHVRTQKFPSASREDSNEGAVLFFIRLKSSAENGSLPVRDDDLPYFIPDDKAANGEPLYSAALVLAHDVLEYAEDAELNLLKNLAFTRDYEFVELLDPRPQPHDLLMLGTTRPRATSLIIEPAFVQIKGGQSQQFIARDGNGDVVNNVNWSVSSVVAPLAVGVIDTNGLYTSYASSLMEQDLLPTTVRAQANIEGSLRTASALLLSNFESVSIAPLVKVITLGGLDFELVASQVGGEALTWTLMEIAPGQPGIGNLEKLSDNRARYTPPANDGDRPLVTLQRIQVKNNAGNEAYASIVLLSTRPALNITPSYVEHLSRKSASVKFEVESTFAAPNAALEWNVLGDGTVNNGLYQGDLNKNLPISVVTCDVVVDKKIAVSGYGIVQPVLRQLEPAKWTNLDTFSITSIEGSPVCFANGLQQIPVRIEIGTASVEDENGEQIYIPISDVELASLKIFDQTTNTELPFIDPAQEGILPGSNVDWAVRTVRNRFRLYDPTKASPTIDTNLATNAVNGKRYKDLYIQTTAQGTVGLCAKFIDSRGVSWASDVRQGENYFLNVTGIKVPTPIVETDYSFKRVRAFNGAGGEYASDDDPFSYVLDSIDYWSIAYTRSGSSIEFATLTFEKNTSMARWESEQRDEFFCSYTGYAFYPSKFDESDEPPVQISFDLALRFFAAFRKYTLNASFKPEAPSVSPGQLIICLNRVADLPFLDSNYGNDDVATDLREILSAPIQLTLIDVDGNKHNLQVSFPARTIVDSRNYLVLNNW